MASLGHGHRWLWKNRKQKKILSVSEPIVTSTAELWHWSLGLNVPLGALNAAFLAFSPESPKYLVLTRGKVREGRRALTKLRPSRTTEEELDEEMRVIKSEGTSAADENVRNKSWFFNLPTSRYG